MCEDALHATVYDMTVQLRRDLLLTQFGPYRHSSLYLLLRCGFPEPAIRRVCEINTMMHDGRAGLRLQHLNSGAKGSSGLKFDLIENAGIGRHTRSERMSSGSKVWSPAESATHS